MGGGSDGIRRVEETGEGRGGSTERDRTTLVYQNKVKARSGKGW